MAGSMRWFTYLDDAARPWAIFLDESNTEAVNGAAANVNTGVANGLGVPRNIETRYVIYRNPAGTITRKITALNNAVAAPDTIVDQVSGETLTGTGTVGERFRVPTTVDTGLIDGDLNG